MAATTKTKTATGSTAGRDTSETVDTMMNAGTGAMKDGFEQAAKGYDQLAGFSRETIDAWMRSANAAARGMEAINTEALTFSRQSMEESMAAARQAMTAKTAQEWMELQSDFTKSVFDSYMGQMSRFSDMFASTARETMEPLNGRFNAFVDMVQSRRAS
ncbi:MAG: phasin family protein [Alphaproteobacteria bacterium]